MLFNSLQFLFFFPVVYLLYLILNHRWQNRLLIAASCLFYCAWNWKFLCVMLLSITTDYFCARRIDQSTDTRTRKLFLFISVGVNLSILAFFKYFNFFAVNAAQLLGAFHITVSWAHALPEIILPIGISFYTFEAVSYITDVYRREVRPARSYWDYLLFVIYFPHLVSGPIMRAKYFLPQITLPRIVTWSHFYGGSYLFFWGLFEKMFVADNLAKIVNPVFSAAGPYEGSGVLLALYAFGFQIFCDFDGYSNMARGLGKCMGFDITVNFNLPYFALNPREFWQRWHISLSSWLRDYLYIPLGGSKYGPARMYAALLVTMLLGGLWHGASWTFILWGLYHAILLIIHRIVRRPEGQEVNKSCFKRTFKMVVFFHLVTFGWLLFRAQSLHQILQMAQALVCDFKVSSQDISSWLKFAAFISPLLALQVWQWKTNEMMIVYKQNWLLRMLIYAFMTYLLFGWGVTKAEEFIYFQF